MDSLLALLPLLACPLMMGLMVWMMRSMQGTQNAAEPAPTSQSTAAQLTHDDQLRDLRVQLTSLQEEREALAREISALEGGQPAGERPAEAATPRANGRGAT